MNDHTTNETQEAADAGREAFENLKDVLGKVVHSAAYGAAFGSGFIGEAAKAFLSESLRETVEKGASDGADAVGKFRSKMSQKNDMAAETPATPEPPAELA